MKRASIVCLQAGLICLLLLCNLRSAAQPGWYDRSRRFSYRLLDSRGDSISFARDTAYRLLVNDRLFRAPHLSHEDLGPLPHNSRNFFDGIRVNDVSVKVPLRSDRLPHIRVAHGRDTMHLWPAADLTLSFQPGHYYFPDWTADLFGPARLRTRGSMRLRNRSLAPFAVPPAQFLRHLVGIYVDNYWLLEETVARQLTDPWLQAERREEPVRILSPLTPFRYPAWTGPLYAAPDSGHFLGLVEYRIDTNSIHWGVRALSVFEPARNRVVHWVPRPSATQFYIQSLHYDPYRKWYYAVAGVRDSAGNPFVHYDTERYPYVPKLFRSQDFGRSWMETDSLQELYARAPFQKIDFLDSIYTVLHWRRQQAPGALWNSQGVYYLLRHFVPVDSLRTPAELNYNDNYNGHYPAWRNDSVMGLGHWGMSDRHPTGTYTEVLVERAGQAWRFRTNERQEQRYWDSVRALPRDTAARERGLGQIVLRRERVLERADGKGGLTLPAAALGLHVHGQFVTLLLPRSTLLSFDGGNSWYYYPRPLDEQASYDLPGTGPGGRFYFWNLREMKKVEYRFAPVRR